MSLNARKILQKQCELSESLIGLSPSERKLYESIKKNPGISRTDIAFKTYLGNNESKRILFSLAKKSLVHIVDNDKIFPMY